LVTSRCSAKDHRWSVGLSLREYPDNIFLCHYYQMYLRSIVIVIEILSPPKKWNNSFFFNYFLMNKKKE
jgi:hypothetical protein